MPTLHDLTNTPQVAPALYRVEYLSAGRINNVYFVHEWLAISAFRIACAAPTDCARLYAPNGELIEKFAVWDHEPGQQVVS